MFPNLKAAEKLYMVSHLLDSTLPEKMKNQFLYNGYWFALNYFPDKRDADTLFYPIPNPPEAIIVRQRKYDAWCRFTEFVIAAEGLFDRVTESQRDLLYNRLRAMTRELLSREDFDQRVFYEDLYRNNNRQVSAVLQAWCRDN